MATIRRREWTTAGGEARAAYLVDMRTAEGRRTYRQFRLKKDADRFLVEARHQVAQGTFTADSASITVEAAADQWLAKAERDGLERSTLAVYRSHCRWHICPALGKLKLSRLTRPQVERWVDDMLASGRSRRLVRAALVSLGALIGEAMRRGQLAQNVARGARVALPQRHQRRPAIPSKADIAALLRAAAGRRRALLHVAIFTGLRASEMRALRWADVDFERKLIMVRQRADGSGSIGSPKSAAARRDIPMGPALEAVLLEWRNRPPRADLVFPGRAGGPLAWGTLTGEIGPAHQYRHFFASWLIDRGFGPKRIQTLLGHASIAMTFDVYGHLFPAEDDHARFAAAEQALLG